MALFSNWIFWIIVYLVSFVIFNQQYKVSTKLMNNSGSFTVVAQMVTSAFTLLLIPFFTIRFPTDMRVYIVLGISIIFYALHDRLATTIRKGLEASTYSIINQLSNVFMIIAGVLLFKEPVVWHRMAGAALILFSNVMIFFEKGKFRFNKYVILAVIANLLYTCAVLIDVNLSEQFNLPFYIILTLFIPAILITIFERIKIKDIVGEFKTGNTKSIIITSIAWSIAILAHLRSLQLGKVTIVAPLSSLGVILNVIVSFLFLKEKDNLLKKIIASLLIMLGIFLIKGF